MHLDRLRRLELRLESLQQHTTRIVEATSPQSTETDSEEADLAELFRLAARVYLERVAKGSSSRGIMEFRNQAFEILQRVPYCEKPWPIFIMATEACNDEERMVILDLLGRSREQRPLGTLQFIERLIHSAWVLQDLQDEPQGADLYGVYNAVISALKVPPSFA